MDNDSRGEDLSVKIDSTNEHLNVNEKAHDKQRKIETQSETETRGKVTPKRTLGKVTPKRAHATVNGNHALS